MGNMAKRYEHSIPEGYEARIEGDKVIIELKESEDERIELLNYLYDVHDDDEERARWIFYLEKQGEHAKFRDSIQVGDKVTRNQDGVLVNLSQLKRVAKPTDKVEPKFKIGDWVVIDGEVLHIEEVTEDGYFTDEGGLIPFRNEKEAHIWTIQDAKDGDVLATSYDILIFEKSLPKDGGVSYCHYDFDCSTPQFNFNKDENWYFGKEAKVYPATKEQRDLLLQKMKEAGYEWDAEKKELKKIESKPAWSEEDKHNLNSVINLVHNTRDGAWGSCVGERIESWLKSLKERVQLQNIAYYNPYQEVVESIAKMCKHYDNMDVGSLQDFYDNVKVKCKDAKEYDSLFSQSQWKPSEEQMEALVSAIDVMIDNRGAGDKNTILLSGLYHELKALYL